MGLSFDAQSNLYIADTWHSAHSMHASRCPTGASSEVVQCETGYSRRKAVIGSMLKARRAGM